MNQKKKVSNGKKWKDMLLYTGMAFAMSLALCACGEVKDAAQTEETQEIAGEPIPEEGVGDDAASQGTVGDGGENGAAADEKAGMDKTEADGSGGTGVDGVNAEIGASQGTSGKPDTGEGTPGNEGMAPASGDMAGTWPDSEPDLEGDIKELTDGQLTVVEAITEESEDGSAGIIMISPGSGGDDSDFNKVSVTYDENTLFAVKTIYDGGARYDLEEAAAADMAAGQFINVWGSSSGGSLTANRICIVRVNGVS